MKLSEITGRVIIGEGQVEPNLMMSISNVINRGFANNTFEFICIARLIQLLRNGDFFKTSNPIFDGNLSTSKELLDHLKSLEPDDIKAIAERLWGSLQIKDNDTLNKLSNPAVNYIEWLKLYTSREAND